MNKRSFEEPTITEYGSYKDLTLKAGTLFTDVPQGTANGGPGTVTGDPTS